MRRKTILREAREWIGTPFHFQGRLKGAGVDCVGLVVKVVEAAGGGDLDDYRFREVRWGRKSMGSGFLAEFGRWCDEHGFKITEDPAPGDLVLCRIGKQEIARHLGWYAGDTIIHVADKQVIEQSAASVNVDRYVSLGAT